MADELDVIHNTLNIIHNGLYDLTTEEKKIIREKVYKKLTQEDFKTIIEGRTIIFYNIQRITWMKYIIQLVNDEDEEAILQMDTHDPVSKYLESTEGIRYADEKVIFLNLSELMDFLWQFRKGNVTKHIDEYFEIIEKKISIFTRHTYDESVIDLVEYQQYTLDGIYHVSDGWMYDIFCFIHDIYNMIQFQKKIDALPLSPNTLEERTVNSFNQIIENKFRIMNSFEFASKYSKFEMDDMVMLYDIMRFKRIQSVLDMDIASVVTDQNPDYTPHGVENIEKVPYRNECFLIYMFNQTFQKMDIYDYYERFYDPDRLFDRVINPLDRVVDISCFIIKSAPHAKYPYSVYLRESKTKIIFDTFSEAMCYIGENTPYNLFS